MPTVTDFSRAYDVKPNTVRRWTAEFADFLSPEANPPTGDIRAYTDDDAHIIALVGEMRAANAPYNRIHAALADGELGMWPPADFDDGQPDPQREQTAAALITQLNADVSRWRGISDTVTDERDRLLVNLEGAREAHLAAEIRATSSETRAEMLPVQLDELKAGNVNL